VFDGEAPTVAFVNQAPWGTSDARYGQLSGHRSSTFVPPESQINVTTRRGRSRSSSGSRACVCATPSGAAKGNFSSAAVVGATSASVIGAS
jgi:hypothetical protein